MTENSSNDPNNRDDASFCRFCGAKFPDGASFCPGCGAPRGAYSRVDVQIERPAPIRVSDWLVASIFTTIVFFPIGLGALVFSLLARCAARSGALPEALGLAEGAKIWNVVLWVVAFGGIVIVAFFCFIAFLFGLAALLF